MQAWDLVLVWDVPIRVFHVLFVFLDIPFQCLRCCRR